MYQAVYYLEKFGKPEILLGIRKKKNILRKTFENACIKKIYFIKLHRKEIFKLFFEQKYLEDWRIFLQGLGYRYPIYISSKNSS